MTIDFFIEGKPEAEPRPRKGKHGNFYRPKGKGWREKVAWLAKAHAPAEPLQGPVSVNLGFVLPPLQSHGPEIAFNPVPHLKRPDLDNLVKNVLDAMTTAKFWKDDGLVYRLTASKHYGSPTGVYIAVTAAWHETAQAAPQKRRAVRLDSGGSEATVL